MNLTRLIPLKKLAWKVIGGRNMLKLQEKAPVIMLVAGIVGVVGSGVLACRATLQVEGVINEAKEKLEKIKNGRETYNEEMYSQKAYVQDLSVTYLQTGVEFVKLYGPSILLGVASVGCLVGSYKIMNGRNVAMIAAYKAVEKSFKDYRDRIVAKYGEDIDRMTKNGITQSEVTTMEIDEKGKSKKTVKIVENIDPNGLSEYSRLFDECNKNWTKDPWYNQTFLKTQQNWANEILRLRGHITLNEVYELLGMEHSDAGLLVGWVRNSGVGDGVVDFGIFDADGNPKTQNFAEGFERSVIVDFNVDGPIYGLIKKENQLKK